MPLIQTLSAKTGAIDAYKLFPNKLPELLASHYRCEWPDVVLMENNISPLDLSRRPSFALARHDSTRTVFVCSSLALRVSRP